MDTAVDDFEDDDESDTFCLACKKGGQLLLCDFPVLCT